MGLMNPVYRVSRAQVFGCYALYVLIFVPILDFGDDSTTELTKWLIEGNNNITDPIRFRNPTLSFNVAVVEHPTETTTNDVFHQFVLVTFASRAHPAN